MKERPILFSGPMVRALLEGRKTQTRRVAPIERLQITPYGDGSVTWSVNFSKAIKSVLGSHSGGKFTEEQARRIIASQFCPYGAPGDRLWVRETFQGPMWEEGTWDPDTDYHSPKYCEYRADGGPTPEYVDFEDNLHQGWKPSIFMPRWASRITLEITGVRVERLNDISETDAANEGLYRLPASGRYVVQKGEQYFGGADRDARVVFADLWDRINGGGAWDANPWVWVVEFKRIEATGDKA